MIRLKRRHSRQITLPEVTLTPLIDTALTLLVIFMVTTPIIQNSIKVKLPEGNVKEAGNAQPQLIVSINEKEQIFINDKPVELTHFATGLEDEIKHYNQRNQLFDKRIWICVDRNKSCSANTLVSVMGCIKELRGGYDVVVATEPSAARTA